MHKMKHVILSLKSFHTMRNAGFYFILLGVSKMTMPTWSILITFIKSCDNIFSINTHGLLKVVKLHTESLSFGLFLSLSIFRTPHPNGN